MSNTNEVNKRIQYSHDDEPSSLTVKTSLLNLLSIIKGSEKDARKFCQNVAVETKSSESFSGGVSHAVFVSGFKAILDEDILSKMKDEDFTGEINERIQYTYDNEPSSMTIKRCLYAALIIKFGNAKEAKKFCQNAAIEAKEKKSVRGKVSNYVFDKAIEVVKKKV